MIFIKMMQVEHCFTSSTKGYTLHEAIIIVKSSSQEWNSRIHTTNNSETVRLSIATPIGRRGHVLLVVCMVSDHVQQIVH